MLSLSLDHNSAKMVSPIRKIVRGIHYLGHKAAALEPLRKGHIALESALNTREVGGNLALADSAHTSIGQIQGRIPSEPALELRSVIKNGG